MSDSVDAEETQTTRASDLLRRRKLLLVLDIDHTMLLATGDERYVPLAPSEEEA